MKALLRQAAILILLFSVLYSSVFAISVFMVPDSKNINTNLWSNIYSGGYGIGVLCLDSSRLQKSSKPKLVFLGSSNVMVGFNPDELQPVFPRYEVANLSSAGANITDIRQTFELLHTLLSREVFRKSVFVIGMWYKIYQGELGPERNIINKLLLTTGVYKMEGNKVCPVVPAKYMYTLVRTLRPFYFIKYALKKWDEYISYSIWAKSKEIRTHINKYLLGNQKKQKDTATIGSNVDLLIEYPMHTSKKGYLTEEDKNWLLEKYLNHKKGEDLKLGNKGFEELLRLCQDAQKWGGTIVLVDLPLPDWHMERSSFFKDYQTRKLSYIHKATQLGYVHYLSLQYGDGLTDEANFTDSTHPKDNVSALWCKSLKERWDAALK